MKLISKHNHPHVSPSGVKLGPTTQLLAAPRLQRISCIFTLLLISGLTTCLPLIAESPASIYEAPDIPVPVTPIDKLVQKQLDKIGVQQTLCSDAVFVRRAYLDVIGRLPTAKEARAFLNDPDLANKRAELIDQLLEHDEFADLWAMRWGDVLRIKAEFPVNLWPNAAQAYHRWVREAIATNMPYDQFARELLTSSGSNYRVGPVNFYRAVQNRTPEGIASAVSLVFMGERTDNWPSDKLEGFSMFFSQIGYKPTNEWKEEHVFWDPLGATELAGNTAPGREAIVPPPPAKPESPNPSPPAPAQNAPAKAEAKPNTPPAAKPVAEKPSSPAPQKEAPAKAEAKPNTPPAAIPVAQKPSSPAPQKEAPAKAEAKSSPPAPPIVVIPEASLPIPPKHPNSAVFPDGQRIDLPSDRDPREVFADWLITSENPRFAQSICNRVWAWLLGRGIVHEADDFRPDNPPVNPELLAYLERELVASHYDLKHIYRLILNSRTYQSSSMPRHLSPEAIANFVSYPLRRMDAEVLIDTINRLTGSSDLYTSAIPEPFTYIPSDLPAVALPDGSITSPFLALFGRSARATGMLNERDNRTLPAQWLHLLNSSHIQQKLEQSTILKRMTPPSRKQSEVIEDLYLTFLSRFPTPEEISAVEGYGLVKPAAEPASASSPKPAPTIVKRHEDWMDLAWALINSSEFLYRH